MSNNDTLSEKPDCFFISPIILERYLHLSGWVNKVDLGTKVKLWHRPEPENYSWEILQPLDHGLRDYDQRVYQAIQILSEFERAPLDVVLSRFKFIDADILRIRVIGSDVDDGLIPLEDGIQLVRKIKDLFVSSSLSVIGKKKHYSGGLPVNVKDFIGRLKLGQTEVGSYVVNVINPISFQTVLPIDTSVFSRVVTDRLSMIMGSLEEAVDGFCNTGDYTYFESASDQGLSANFCDALVGIGGVTKERDFELSLRLSPLIDCGDKHEIKYFIPASYSEVLVKASKYLKDDYEIPDFVVLGVVIGLERKVSDLGGKVTVKADFYSKQKIISFSLGAEDYSRAIESHKSGSAIKCKGLLVVKKKKALLVNASNFEVLVNKDMFLE